MRIVTVCSVFLVGMIVGHVTQEKPKEREPAPLDLSGDIVIAPQSGASPTLTFRPYMIQTKETTDHVDLLHEGEEMWFVQLDGGRVQMQVARVPR